MLLVKISLSLPLPPFYLPGDDVGSKADHERADEGTDLPGCSLSPPLLLLQTTLSNTDQGNMWFHII